MTLRRLLDPTRGLWLLGLALACAKSTAEEETTPTTGGQSPTATGGTSGTTTGTAGSSGGTLGASGGSSSGGFGVMGGWPTTGGWSATGGRPEMNLPYTDDFEDGVLDGWIRDDNRTAVTTSWSIVTDPTAATNHVLQLGAGGSDDTWEVGGNYRWTDQSLTVRVRFTSTSGYAFAAVRFAGVDSYYYLQIRPGSTPKIRARTNLGGSTSTSDVCLGSGNFPGTVGNWYTLNVTAQGSNLSASWDNNAICTGANAAIPAGGIAIGSDGVQVFFDDVSVTAS